MVFFVVQHYHEYTVENFLQTWARPLAERVGVLNWVELADLGRLHRGTYVLCDFERMTPAQIDLAGITARRLGEAGCRVLNHPERVLSRAALLAELRRRGINDFRAYVVGSEDLAGVRFPCFVRRVSTHMGTMSELLENRAQLDAEIARRRAAGESDLLVIEYLDTASRDPGDPHPGIYRKYGVFRCGECLVGRHIYFSRRWLQSSSDVVEDWTVDEEAAFMDANPHQEEIRSIFEIGGVDYGRVDYAMQAGRPQVWEINTNPMLLAAPDRFDPRRLPAQSRGAAATTAAIRAIDDGRNYEPDLNESWIDLEIPASLRDRLGASRGDAALRILGKAMMHLGRAPGLRQVVQICQRAHRLAGDPPQRPRRAA